MTERILIIKTWRTCYMETNITVQSKRLRESLCKNICTHWSVSGKRCLWSDVLLTYVSKSVILKQISILQHLYAYKPFST